MKTLSYALILSVVFPVSAVMAQDEGAQRDLEIISQHYGISVDAARERVMLQRDAARLNKELKDQPNFSGMELVTDQGEMSVNVSFAQGAPVPQHVLDRYLSLKGKLTVRTTGRALAAQKSLRGRISAALARQKIDASIQSNSIDGGVLIKTNQVDLVREALEGITGDIEIEYVKNPVPLPTVNLVGGQSMSSAKGACTSGFGAQDYLYKTQKGILTAGHCAIDWNGTLPTGTTMTQQGVSIPVLRAKFYAEDDFLFAYSASHPSSNLFFDGVSNRPVTSIRYALVVKGQDVCKYGKVTGLKCGVVTEPEMVWSTSNIGPLVEVYSSWNENIAQCGDSGGPIFMMNEAYGIMSRGDVNGKCLGGNKAYYADIYYGGEVGAEVLTQ